MKQNEKNPYYRSNQSYNYSYDYNYANSSKAPKEPKKSPSKRSVVFIAVIAGLILGLLLVFAILPNTSLPMHAAKSKAEQKLDLYLLKDYTFEGSSIEQRFDTGELLYHDEDGVQFAVHVSWGTRAFDFINPRITCAYAREYADQHIPDAYKIIDDVDGASFDTSKHAIIVDSNIEDEDVDELCKAVAEYLNTVRTPAKKNNDYFIYEYYVSIYYRYPDDEYYGSSIDAPIGTEADILASQVYTSYLSGKKYSAEYREKSLSGEL